MKFCAQFVGVLAIVAVVYGNPYADEGVWRWNTKMPTVTPNIRARPFPQAILPRIPRGRSVVDPVIVGGAEATPHAYPYQAALFMDSGYFCGGILISDSWVLTAAHCTIDSNSQGVQVVLGAHDISTNEATQVTVRSTSVTNHPDYDSTYLVNDVALVGFQSVTLTGEIQPVALPCVGDDPVGAGVDLTATGWGKISDASLGITDNLKVVTNPSISNDDCAAVYGSTTVNDGSICIEYQGGGTCSGDSGGPLTQTSGGATTVVGVTSFVSASGCESGYPDGFTRVLSYLDFIGANTDIDIC